MELSAKMPAMMDATLPAKMDDQMPSDSQMTGGGESMQAPVVAIIRDSQPNDNQWMNLQEKGPAYETADKKTGADWELTDRKEGENG